MQLKPRQLVAVAARAPRRARRLLHDVLPTSAPLVTVSGGDSGRQPREVRDRVHAQVQLVREAYGDDVAVWSATGHDGDAEFLYHPRRLLVRSRDVERVREAFEADKHYDGVGEADRSRLDGLVVYTPPARRRSDVNALQAVADLERRLPPGVVTLDHLLHVSGGTGRLCPATEPELPPSETPLPAVTDDADAGRGVRVSVVDTGWWPKAAAHDWLDDDGIEGDVETVDPTKIHPYAGHGTFVTGVLRCLAPATDVEVEGVLTTGGAIYESKIVEELHEAVTDPDGPDLISISAGGRTRNGAPMLSFLVLRDDARHGLKKRNGRPALIVAAAGNDGADWPLYPAAFDWVLSVGSLDADGSVSDFSNYGDWVDVYARGRDLINAFPHGTYTCHEPDHLGEVREFEGMAQWSGTSFSTPVVSGTLARYMSGGMSAHAAKAMLISDGRLITAPDGSTGFAVAEF
ncbi:S8/S53 family peptidase [Nocardioides sp. C4-1]|uniref:S8 family peptidase n=1 Tax=Nocardioides sp. C4-1 TaxID=3151851 RepID=UPI003265094D